MKCTWPTLDPTPGMPTQPIFHWLVLGLLGLALGLQGFALGLVSFALAFCIPTCWYLQHKMVVLGVLTNARPLREWFHVAMKYIKSNVMLQRLKIVIFAMHRVNLCRSSIRGLRLVVGRCHGEFCLQIRQTY